MYAFSLGDSISCDSISKTFDKFMNKALRRPP